MDTKINVIAIMFSTGLQLKKAHEHARRLCFRISANFLKESFVWRLGWNWVWWWDEQFTTKVTICDPPTGILARMDIYGIFARWTKQIAGWCMCPCIRKKKPHLKEHTRDHMATKFIPIVNNTWYMANIPTRRSHIFYSTYASWKKKKLHKDGCQAWKIIA